MYPAFTRTTDQKVDVEVGDRDSLGDRAVGLPKVVSPFRKARPIPLMLDQMSAFAVSREKPLPLLGGMEYPTQPQNSHEASDHRTRERNVEGPDLASSVGKATPSSSSPVRRGKRGARITTR